MPKYQFPLNTTESHKWFDGLTGFARGYVEAAFFCGVHFDDNGETVEIDGLGAANLDAEARAGLEAQAVRFWLANAPAIAEACEAGDSYDLEAAGRDLWFTRNGHGVGYWDRGLGDVGEALSEAASAAGEVDLFPVPLDPDTGEPLPGHHVDHNAPSDADPDPEDAEAWRVFLMFPESPLTEAERAARLALEAETTGGPAFPLADVGGRYGAPLGRQSGTLERGEPVTVQRVTLDADGYDSGGAYWGAGSPLWRVSGKVSGERVYLRAPDSRAALDAARAEAAA